MSKTELLRKALREKRCVKIIAGISNFDIEKVKKVVTAAQQGGADAVDVAARKDVIYTAKQSTKLSVFVSSIIPEELKMAASCGADVLEIGNYDALYREGLRITAQQVLEITKKTMELVDKEVMLSVTVPGHIDISEQVNLAMELEALGVDLIQTEGAAVADIKNSGIKGLMEIAHESISNTAELVRNVSIPVMTASGITATTAPLTIAAGASAVGVGSAVNKLESLFEMTIVVRSIVESISSLRNSAEEEILA